MSIRHSTLLPWLQNGQEKTVSSLSIRFLGGGLAADFLFPMVQLLFFLAGARRRQGGGKGTGEDLGTWRRAAATTVAQLSQDKRIAGDGGSRATFSGGGYVALGSPPSPSAEFSERAVVWTKEPAAGEKSGVACPSI
uniref:Uncharacterized protein n=2 Tax=Zea mays TaxID=4577 RepID=C4J199_MAIZE|nr:unknown [Zea mays]